MVDRSIAAGLTWIANYRGGVAGMVQGDLYTAYALERVGMLANLTRIGGVDWYRAGAARLIAKQHGNGSWNYRNQVVGTAIGLLFLGKGRAPVLVSKLRIQPDAVARIGDVHAWVEDASRAFKTRYTWQTADWQTPLNETLTAPIVFINGYKPWQPTDAQLGQLRQMIRSGATIVVNACSPVFERSFRAQIGRLLVGAKLVRLAPDHPIYNSHAPITEPGLKFLEGASWNCRMPLIFSPRDLTYGWLTGRPHHGLGGRDCRRLGLNIIRFIVARGRRLDRLAQVHVVRGGGQAAPAGPRGKVPPGALIPALVRHGGDFNPDPEVFAHVLASLRQQLPLVASAEARTITLDHADLFNHPFLIIKGHRAFTLGDAEVKRLRRYLQAGGFCYIECCCAAPMFDRAARQLVKVLLPKRSLARLPDDHPLWQVGGPQDKVEFTALARRAPGLPPLEGIALQGRLALAYLPMAAGCAVSEHPRGACIGIKRKDDALDLYRRLVLYAMAR